MQIKLAIKVHNFRTGSLVYHVKVHPFRKSPYPIQTSQNWQNYRSFSVRLQRKQTVLSLSLQNPDPGDTATLPLLSLYKYRLRCAATSVLQQTPTPHRHRSCYQSITERGLCRTHYSTLLSTAKVIVQIRIH